MGRKKLPASIKKIRGTYREDRDAEPVQFDPRVPPLPDGLRPEVEAEWNRLAPLLTAKGLLTEVDWLAWTLGMRAYDTWLSATESVDKDNWVVWSEKGAPYQHPMIGIASKAYQAVLTFCREFGLTPSARSGLKINGGPLETDEFGDHVAKGQ